MRHPRLMCTMVALFAVGMVFSAPGCDPALEKPETILPPGDNEPSERPAERPAGERLAGIWQTGDEKDLLGFDLSFSFDGREVNVEYLVMNDDGTATIVFHDASTSLIDASRPFSPIGEDSLLLEDEINFNVSRLKLMHYRLESDDELTIFTSEGRTIELVRRAEVPAEMQVRHLVEVEARPISPRIEFDSGLAFDGENLWYTADDNKSYPIPLEGETAAQPLTFATSWNSVHAAQADDFWLKASPTRHAVQRARAGELVDEVSLLELTGENLLINCVAADSGSPLLWFHAEDPAGNEGRIMLVDAGAEPDVLLAEAPFPHYVPAMAWNGQSLYVLTYLFHPLIARIEPQTMKVVETYVLSNDADNAIGLALVGSEFYVIGDMFSRGTTLLRLAPQQ